MDSAKRPDISGSNASLGGGGPAPTGSLPDIQAAAAAGTYFLGRYRVVDEIGIGGMASVHLARMDGPGGFQKWVAVKKIHPHLVEDESFVQMFLDEARVAARISHPNVATVFDLGKHEDTYWIAMEYLHGEPLREVMRRTEELGTAMPPEIACRVIADAAEGLHSAHELLGKNGEKLGLVHRDVTPHNLFVTYEGVTKVVDFGIAKFTTRMAHTRAGTLKGKLAYMSPEQVHGEGIDRRTDIFALGVVLWELTTGQRLFRMESDLDTLAKVQECNVPRPSTIIRGYPVDLEKIVMKALSKNRGERFRTTRELSRALQSLLMRRGLFIASDEVAAYTQSIFTDRIQKREAHLRWAAEVTQTINVEQMLAKPQIGPEYTSSEVQAARESQSRPPTGAAVVRPAAGMPASDPLVQTGPSRTTSARPAAGAAVRATARPAPPPPPPEEPHPADGDGPTVQAIPEMLQDALSQSGLGDAPTLMEHHPANTEQPTVMAPLGAPLPRPFHSPLEDEPDDETVVARPGGDSGPLRAPPTFPQARQTMPQPMSPPGRFGATGPLGGGPPPPNNQPASAGFGPVMPETFGKTLGLGQLSPYTEANADLHTRIAHPSGPQPDHAQRQQMQMQMQGQPMSGQYAQSPMTRQPNGGWDNRTMTVERFRRRPPMWVVAALSCSIALLLAGIVVAIYAATSGPSSTSSAKAEPNGQPAVVGGASATSAGPFTSARIAFNGVTSGGPSSSAPPTPVPVPPPVVTAPPAATAPPVAPPVMGDLPPSPTVAAATTTADPPSTAVVKPADPPAAKTATAPSAAPPATTAAPVAKPADPAPSAKPATTAKPGALGAITIVCMPKCDQIIDNGTPLGAGHIFNRPVPAGRHVLVLSAPNGVKKNLQVEVAPEQTREVRIPMDK